MQQHIILFSEKYSSSKGYLSEAAHTVSKESKPEACSDIKSFKPACADRVVEAVIGTDSRLTRIPSVSNYFESLVPNLEELSPKLVVY